MISICIPTLNRADLLRKNLERLLNFKDLNIEVNISDNGSADQTSRVIEEYRHKFPRFNSTFFNQTIPAVYNWDSVIRMATQKYVFALADDDTSLEEGLLKAVALMESNNEIGAVYGGYKEFNLEEQFLADTVKSTAIEVYGNGDRIPLIKKYWSLEVPVIRRCAYEKCASVNEVSWILSWSALSQLLNSGYKVAVTPYCLFQHYIHKNRFTEQKSADPHFNFALISEAETFLSATDAPRQQKLEALFLYKTRLYNFQAKVCLRNSNYLQARVFLNKGFMYSPNHFKTQIDQWNHNHLLLAAFQEIRSRILSKEGICRLIIIASHANERNFLDRHLHTPADLQRVHTPNLNEVDQYDPQRDFIISYGPEPLEALSAKRNTVDLHNILNLLKFGKGQIKINLNPS